MRPATVNRRRDAEERTLCVGPRARAVFRSFRPQRRDAKKRRRAGSLGAPGGYRVFWVVQVGQTRS